MSRRHRCFERRRVAHFVRAAIFCASSVALTFSSSVRAQRTPTVAAPAPAAPTLVAPHLVSEPSVPYPDGQSRDVRVVLTVVVNADGTVRSAAPEIDDEPFSSLASTAAMQWRFEPATRDGRPIAGKMKMEVAFHPPPPPSPTPSPDENEASEKKPDAAPKPKSPKSNVSPVDEVRVHGKRSDPAVTASLTRAEVREIPGTFGDPFRAIDTMPGVTPIISGLPFFFVRGAPPGDVGYFLDGIPVPYLFHIGAGPSIVHPALVDRVDLYPGGYPASFGRYSGGIVSGETIEPAREAHGEYNVRIFDAGALVETPFANGRGTVLVGGRYSYTGLVLTLANTGAILNYWDYQGRLTYDLTPKDRVTLFAFGAHDYLGQKESDGTTTTIFGVDFHRIDLRYDHFLGKDAMVRTAVTVGLDETQLDEGRVLRDRSVRLRNELTYVLSRDALFRAGTDAELDAYDVVLPNVQPGSDEAEFVTLFPSRTDLATGMHADVVIHAGDRLEITPGARLDLYGSQGASAVGFDPRLSARTRLSEKVHLLAATGIAHQTPSFVVPAPGFQPGGLKGGLQTAVQESTGIELDLGAGTTATATLFHNAFFNLSDALSVPAPTTTNNTCSSAPSPASAGVSGAPTDGTDCTGGSTQSFETRADGNAYGLELYVKRKLTKHLGGFLSYTLSRSTRTAQNANFIASFDRTHVANAAVAYDLGRGWRAGSRVMFYTGLPRAPDANDPSGGRLPPFFRLDLRLEKRWQLSRKWWISFVAEWMNVTLSKEAIGTDCTLDGCKEETIGPVTIPSLGVEGGF